MDHVMDIDPTTTVLDQLNRPLALLDDRQMNTAPLSQRLADQARLGRSHYAFDESNWGMVQKRCPEFGRKFR